MLIVITGLSIGLFFVLAFLAVMTIFKKPLGGSLIITYGLFICTEAVLLNILSQFSLVSTWGLWVGHGIIGLALFLLNKKHIGARINELLIGLSHFKSLLGASNGLLLALIPLVILVFVVALLFPPNNWDSMTYHMARVVYWLQYGSVSYYPTAIARQNVMTPGAEYLILVLQGMSRSDVFANMVQFSAWIISIFSLPSILRGFMVSRRFLPWAVVFVATIPMAVLQATTTQNDLVAACLTLGVLYALLPFMNKQALHIRPYRSILLLACMISAAYLVKPTSLLVAFPFILFALFRSGKILLKVWSLKSITQAIRMLLLCALIGIVICGPDIYRKHVLTGSFTGNRGEVFSLFGFWGEKLIHPISGLSINTPFQTGIYDYIIQPMVRLFKTNLSFAPHHSPFIVHEGLIGYVLQAAALAVMFFMLFTPKRRRKIFFILFVISWILFHITIKPQPWLSRLQLPLFFILPLGFGLFSDRPGILAEKLLLKILLAICLLGIPYAYFIIAKNPSAPLRAISKDFFTDRSKWYYVNRDLTANHQRVLNICRDFKIKKVGLIVDEDAYDYPLSWRLYLSGIHVDHILPANNLQEYDLIYASVPIKLPPNWLLIEPKTVEPNTYISQKLQILKPDCGRP